MKCLMALAFGLILTASVNAQQTYVPQQPQYIIGRTPGLLTPIGRLLFGRRVLMQVQPIQPVQPQYIVQPQPPVVYQYVPGRVYQTPGQYFRVQ